MKKGIALLITLSFLIIAMGIISSILLFYKEISSNSFEYSITEDNLIINSLKSKLKSVNIHSKSDRDKLLDFIYLLNTQNFGVSVDITPLNNRLNINKFIDKNQTNVVFSDIFDNFCNINKIKNCYFLKNILLDTIDKDDEEREEFSEIKKYQPFKNGEIDSFKQLKIISNYYYSHTNDQNIFKFKWQDFFNIKGNYLDCDILSKNSAKLLNIDDVQPLTCEVIYDSFSDYFIKKLDIIPFDKKREFYINIHINYRFHNSHTLDILYDTKQKRIINIEKHFIY